MTDNSITFEQCLECLGMDDQDLYKMGLFLTDNQYDYDTDEENVGEREINIVDNQTERKRKKLDTLPVVKPFGGEVIDSEPGPHPNLPNPPFSMTLIGKPGSGKTTTELNLLQWYDGYFDQIFIWSPTIPIDLQWTRLIKSGELDIKRENIFKRFKEQDLKRIIKDIKKVNKGKESYPDKIRTLFVFDDIISELPRKQKTLFNSLIFNHRHLGISYMVISQEYVSIPPKLRKSSFGTILYNTNNMLEKNKIIEEVGGTIGKNLFESLFDTVTGQKHCFLYVNNKSSDIDNKFYQCFEKPIKVSDLKNGTYEDDDEDDDDDDEDVNNEQES